MSIKVFETRVATWEVYNTIMHLPYTFTRTDVPPHPGAPEIDPKGLYWTHQLYNYCPVDDPDYFQNAGLSDSKHPVYLDILTYLEATLPQMPSRDLLYSAYINVLRAGDSPGIHCDAPYFEPQNKTVILYLNPEWNPEWGGETIFFDDDLDAKFLVQPRPGRVVMFDGRIPHTGRPPTPKYGHNRYILSLKYMDPDSRHRLFVDHEMNNMPPVVDRGIAGFDPKTVKEIWRNIALS
jgi:hypothetical protein